MVCNYYWVFLLFSLLCLRHESQEVTTRPQRSRSEIYFIYLLHLHKILEGLYFHFSLYVCLSVSMLAGELLYRFWCSFLLNLVLCQWSDQVRRRLNVTITVTKKFKKQKKKKNTKNSNMHTFTCIHAMLLPSCFTPNMSISCKKARS